MRQKVNTKYIQKEKEFKIDKPSPIRSLLISQESSSHNLISSPFIETQGQVNHRIQPIRDLKNFTTYRAAINKRIPAFKICYAEKKKLQQIQMKNHNVLYLTIKNCSKIKDPFYNQAYKFNIYFQSCSSGSLDI